MSRNASSDVNEIEEAARAADHHAFWDGPSDLDETLAIPAEDPSIDGEHETRVYMGRLRHTDAERAELDALADWAEGHACDECRDSIGADHDPDALEHDECRNALRASRLLRRYP